MTVTCPVDASGVEGTYWTLTVHIVPTVRTVAAVQFPLESEKVPVPLSLVTEGADVNVNDAVPVF